MLDVLIAVILGIVEGITEWLPISSTGHMILVEQFLHMSTSHEFNSMFRVVIQLGAIMAVVVLYFHKLNPFSPKKTQKQKLLTWQMWISFQRENQRSRREIQSTCGAKSLWLVCRQL